jgi:hypothetical protein
MSAIFGGNRFVLPAGQTTAVFPVASGAVISPGDLLYWNAGSSVVSPLSAKTGAGAAVLDQSDISSLFAGVALQGRIAAQTTSGYPANPANGINVAVDCVYEADCASATFEIGDLVGVISSGAAAAAAISDQSVVAVARENLAIGFVIARYASATTKVRIQLYGKATHAGNPNINGAIGARQNAASASLADSNVTLTVASAPIQIGVPTAARDVTLPAVAYSTGLQFYVVNNSAGANTITVKNAAAATIASVAQNKRAVLFCDGTTWFGLVGA